VWHTIFVLRGCFDLVFEAENDGF